jgi:hypothetical protein
MRFVVIRFTRFTRHDANTKCYKNVYIIVKQTSKVKSMMNPIESLTKHLTIFVYLFLLLFRIGQDVMYFC